MRALIYGISGQDGAYLTRLLRDKGYTVFGTSRDAQTASFANLRQLGLFDEVTLSSVAVNDFRSVLQSLIQSEPDEIYNLSGQSSVALSFEQPVETMESISIATLNILEAIRFLGRPVRFYNAGSSECFGDTGDARATESTPFRPRSPYAVAKAAAHWQVAAYREAYGLHASTGILFNHESPLRPERFVTRKIIAAVVRIARGSRERLVLGNTDIVRDWGWAPEYVEAMWRILQQEQPEDFVIATGVSHRLRDFVALAFEMAGLDWRDHTEQGAELMRAGDLRTSRADPGQARARLGWSAQTDLPTLVRRLLQAEGLPRG